MNPVPTPTPIRMAVRSVESLVDPGGSPLAGPRIHPDAAHHLYEQARVCRNAKSFFVEIEAPAADAPREAEAAAAVRGHFAKDAGDAGSDIAEVMRLGYLGLGVSLALLAVLLLVAETIEQLGDFRIFSLLGHSLVIIAWVVFWSPAEKLLYEHLPIRRRRKIALALATAEVRLVAAPPDASAAAPTVPK